MQSNYIIVSGSNFILKKITKDDLLVNDITYAIFMVKGDAWYVISKINKSLYKRFGFENVNNSYINVINYAMTI